MSSWEVRFSNSRQLPYFYNAGTGESVWEAPAGLSNEQIKALPGAHHLGGGGGASSGGGGGGAPSKVRASHLLIKHRDSRRPSSWKETNITRSPQEAESILREHMNALGSNPTTEQFGQLASIHSDCSSAQKGGDLGFFSRGQMQKPFEDAAFGLPVGGLSGVVQTDSGTHVIMRTG
ncbi:rotamase-domain-containing protein [Jaminaea rosea]|uniref:Peptidyl-prolyl cis-trans isomerase n=1 Tax=Jaminaea rosea TaxID=1569628 RepID=A0A316UQQ3_9BASI|nr:rotamase-domain-containing protein [Jaminaea rosea]PWN27620.1 rotamase-domain-containing protein [Jaminaea rosea]